MFKLKPNPTFENAVRIGTPEGSVKLTLTFRHKGKDALSAWISASKDRPAIDTLLEIVCGWKEVAAEDGALLPFSTEAFSCLLNDYPGASDAIFMHYLKALRGEAEKN